MLLNLGGHGLGDCLLSLQISYLLKEKRISHTNCISTRSQIFGPLKHLFGEKYDFIQVDELYTHNNKVILNHDMQRELKQKFNCDDLTYNVPDLLFHHPLALNFDKYSLNPQLIKKQRLLTNTLIKKEKIVYCGLATSTQGYLYSHIKNLLIALACSLPDYTIYLPNVKKWDKDINMGDLTGEFPSNVLIHENPEFEDSLDYLSKSKYGIFTCNGPSHIAYHLGIPRLILDPQFEKVPWMSRWKEDFGECIDINTQYTDIVDLVAANIKNPETTLIDRKRFLELIKNGYNNWKDAFLLKY